MAIQTVNTGTTPNDGTGDPARTAFTKLNSNFTTAENAASRLVATSAQALAGTADVLPDAAGVHAAIRGLSVGTVSQSGGVPTGAIIESGSNANGEYVKYADGTMICAKSYSFTSGGGESIGGSLFRTGHGSPLSFPVVFSGLPKLSFALRNEGSVFTHWIGDFNPASNSSYRVELIGTSATTPPDLTISMLAFGRWF